MEFYSHPKKSLTDHLNNVALSIETKINNTIINIDNKDKLKEIGKRIGLSHDFGKFTSYFQRKLNENKNENENENENEVVRNDSLGNHGLLSAVFSFYFVRDYLKEEKLLENKYFKYFPLISFQVIKHHHGNLNYIVKDVITIKENNEELIQQFNDIIDNISKINLEEDLFKGVDKNFLKSIINELNIEEYKYQFNYDIAEMEFNYNFNELDEELKYYYFIMNQYFYSLLISYDKIDASNTSTPNKVEINENIVDSFREKYFNSNKEEKNSNDNSNKSLNDIRNEIYNNVDNKIKEIKKNDVNTHIFTITSPTGSGKTLTGFNAAVKLKNKLNSNHKIIYCLPFTSIIDQNYEVIEKILSEIENFNKNKNLYLLKHHYFSNIKYMENNEYRPIEEALLLTENWESEIIITTFLQLFYTLIGYQNKALKKFHNIVNSIILLDEVQNIPVKYWKIINMILKILTKYFSCYVILMTATKPLIFNKNESIELLENNMDYFKKLNRTKLVLNKCNDKIEIKKYKINELIEEIKKDKNCYNSLLVVCNTISYSIELLDKITKDSQSFKDFNIIYLSTNITPYERKERINKIKEFINKKKKVIIISTQLIEAGVDIDVDIVYRDLAPLDSIIQAAGRSNRNNKKEKQGIVKIVNMIDDKNNDKDNNKNNGVWKYVYDKITVEEATIPVLLSFINNNKCEIEENNYFEMINNYYEKIIMKKSQDESIKLLNSIKEFYYNDETNSKNKIPISEFKLIENLPGYVSVFVEINDFAKKIWKDFTDNILNLDKKNTKNYLLKKKENFTKIKGDYYNFIINIPDYEVKDKENIEKIFDDLYYISNNNLSYIYNFENEKGKGFIREDKEKKVSIL